MVVQGKGALPCFRWDGRPHPGRVGWRLQEKPQKRELGVAKPLLPHSPGPGGSNWRDPLPAGLRLPTLCRASPTGAAASGGGSDSSGRLVLKAGECRFASSLLRAHPFETWIPLLSNIHPDALSPNAFVAMQLSSEIFASCHWRARVKRASASFFLTEACMQG